MQKLTSYIDLETSNYIKEGEADAIRKSTVAMEKAIIKSRLKIPFWKSYDEAQMLICSKHRHSILRNKNVDVCLMCKKPIEHSSTRENDFVTSTSNKVATYITYR